MKTEARRVINDNEARSNLNTEYITVALIFGKSDLGHDT